MRKLLSNINRLSITQFYHIMADFEVEHEFASGGASNSSDTEKCETDVVTPPKKRVKRLCSFQTSWESEFTWCRKVSGNCFEAQCTLCSKKFSIGHGGRNDLTTHAKSDSHTRYVMAAKCSSVRSFFVKSAPTGIDRQVRNANFLV